MRSLAKSRSRVAETIFDFTKPESAAYFKPIDDVVMGGVSSSQLLYKDGFTHFQGVLSLERGGGFASVRTEIKEVDLSAFEGLALRFRGDGKVYQLRLQTDAADVFYAAEFEALPDWETFHMPFHTFMGVYRGEPVQNAPDINLERVVSFGLMIANAQAGEFGLELASLDAYTRSERP